MSESFAPISQYMTDNTNDIPRPEEESLPEGKREELTGPTDSMESADTTPVSTDSRNADVEPNLVGQTTPAVKPTPASPVEENTPTEPVVVSAAESSNNNFPSQEIKFPSSWKKGIALSLGGTVIVSSILAGYVGYMSGFSAGKDAGESVTAQLAALEETDANPIIVDDSGSSSVADIAAAVSPSVVKINVLNASGDFEVATGSGVVIDKNGHIVTNAHVAKPDDADKHTLQVVLPDKEVIEASLVGYSQDYDIAVLKIDQTNVPYATWGDSDALKVGEMVVALGSPLGLQGTVTSGIVSAVERPVAAGGSENGSFLNAIQTDAAINPGNSGGPLANTEAKVIGINTAIATLPTPFAANGEGSIGLGFAIPSNVAKRVANEIIKDGKAETPGIGIIIDNTYTDGGVKVLEVTPESPSQKAGIRAGDVITSVNGKKVEESLELVVAIRSNSVGDDVSIEVSRDGTTEKLTLTLEPLNVVLPSATPDPNGDEPEEDSAEDPIE